MRFASHFRLFVLHISKDLVQIGGVQGIHIILRLCRMRIILGINNEDFTPFCQPNVALHYWKHCADAIIQRPWNLGCRCCYLGTLLDIVLQDEFLIKAAHPLLINPGGKTVFTGIRGQEHSLQNQLTQMHEHTIRVVIALKPYGGPADPTGIHGINLRKEQQLLFQSIFVLLIHPCVTEQEQNCRFENLIPQVVL